MRKQRGLTLTGLLFFLALMGVFAWIAFKTVPTYMDYYTVRHSLENILQQSDDLANDKALRDTFDNRLNVNFIKGITARDLEIDREEGMITLTVPISRKEHLVGGISVCVDLEAVARTPYKK